MRMVVSKGQVIQVRGVSRQVESAHWRLSLALSSMPHALWIKFADGGNAYEKFVSDANGAWAELEETE